MAALTAERKDAIRRSWRPVKADLSGNGIGFLIKLFTDFPEYMAHFPEFAGRPVEEIKSLKKTRTHGLVLMNKLDTIVSNLDNLDVIVSALHVIVAKHRPRQIGYRHFVNAFQVFADYMSVTLGEKFDEGAQDGWQTAIDVMLTVIEDEARRLGAGDTQGSD